VSLAEALTKRDALKATLRDGGDPMAPRRAKVGGLTFQEACERYWKGGEDVSLRDRVSATRAFEIHLHPKLGQRPNCRIERADLLVELDRIEEAGLQEYVRKTHMWVS